MRKGIVNANNGKWNPVYPPAMSQETITWEICIPLFLEKVDTNSPSLFHVQFLGFAAKLE